MILRHRIVCALLVALAGLSLGCGTVRATSRNATLGALDALRSPDDPLLVEIRALVKKYVDGALKAGPPEPIEDIAAKITAGVLKAVGEQGPAQREMVRGLVREALAGGVDALRSELPAPEPAVRRVAAAFTGGLTDGITSRKDAIAETMRRASEAAGGAFARASSEQLAAELEKALGPDAEGPLARALSRAMARTTGAVIAGAREEVAKAAPECPSSDPTKCPPSLVRRMSRAAAMGFAEGVERKTDPWPLVISFGIGFVIAAIGAWVKHALEARRPPRVPLR